MKLPVGEKTADKGGMSPVNPLSSNSYLQSILGKALQGTGVSTSNNTGSSTSINASSLTPDNSQFSPVANLMNTLQQLQQNDPSKYQQVTAQIATNLQNAAQTAQTQGNTAAAGELSQLSSAFSQASQSGQLPGAQSLTQALGGHHHHHGHHHAESSSDATSSSSSTPSSSSTSSTSSSSSSTNPFDIIMSTLSSAGITVSGSAQSSQA